MICKKGLMSQRGFICCIFVSILMALVTGCVTDSAKQIKIFSDATVLTANNATEAFKMVEESHFNEEVSEAVLNFDDTNNIGFNPLKIQPFMNTNALQIRLDILEGLKTYAAKLSVLMGNSALTNFDQEIGRAHV